MFLANGTGILILQPKKYAFLMIGMPAFQFNDIFAHLHLILADWTCLSSLFRFAVVQFLDLFFAESLGDLADLVAKVE